MANVPADQSWFMSTLWQAFATTAYVGTHLVTGGSIERLDEGGARYLAGTSPIIVAPNHLGHGDGGIIAMSLPIARRRRLRLVADHASISLWSGANDWRTRFWHRLLLTLTLKSYRAIVVRGELRGSQAVCSMVKALREGDTILIFPEGDFGSAEALRPLRVGVAELAIATGAVIVPIRIDGTSSAMPTVRRLRTRPMATARFRPAIVAGPKDDVQAVLKKLEATLSPDPRIRAEASLTARACVKPDD
jgi:1-acyl-sn-glycerol-3-phosphate acyltransferase